MLFDPDKTGYRVYQGMETQLSIILISILLTCITSCGFQLRGTQPNYLSNISTIHIIDDNASTVGSEIRSRLSLSGITITPTSEEAEYTLQLYNQSINESILSISATTGKVEEYKLLLTVRMTLTDGDKNARLTNQLIRINRDYAFDDRAVLGSENERQTLVDVMIRQAATQIIQRLITLTQL